ncbi:MAG: hypothetical protein ACOZAR_05110 [Patescibacteria group bacterium]
MLDKRRFGFKRRLMGKSNSSMVEYSRVKFKEGSLDGATEDYSSVGSSVLTKESKEKIDKKRIRFSSKNDKQNIIEEVLKKIREIENIE